MQSKVANPVAKVIRVISAVLCLIVIASFVIFAVEQTEGASNHQQNVLNESAPVSPGAQPPGKSASGQSTSTSSVSRTGEETHKGSVHKTIDEASNKLTSPFSGLTSGSSSLWLERSANLVLALLVYGFGLGFLARVLRVRM